jgi:hypothetical protein
MNSTVAGMLEALRKAETRYVRRRGTDERVWELKGSSSKVEAVRDQLIGCAIASAEPVIVVYDEDEPITEELKDYIMRFAVSRFELRGAIPLEPLRRWLYLGNWQMLSSTAPTVLIDVVRAKPDEVMRFVDENGLDFVIDSFHDDTFWAVGLNL